MKNIFFISLLFHSFFVSGQIAEIKYHFIFENNNEYFDSKLSIFKDYDSVFEIFEYGDMFSDRTHEDSIITFKPPIYLNRIIVKRPAIDSLYYYKEDGNNFYCIQDVLQQTSWELTEESKVILDFNCQKAIGKFKNRLYTVWYTPEIPYADGPWKFSGLPGLILEVENQDKTFIIEATEIALSPHNTSLHNLTNIPIKKTFSWDEYVELKKEYLNKLAKYFKSSSSYDISINNIKYEEPDFRLTLDE